MDKHFVMLSDFEFKTEDLLSAEAMLYGAGLFETLYIDANGIEFFEAHLERLKAGAAALEIPLPRYLEAVDDLRSKLMAAFKALELNQASLRIQLTSTNGRGLCWGHFRAFNYTASQYDTGFKLGIKPTNLLESDGLSAFKVSNYLRHWQGRKELQDKGLDEYLWLNPTGRVTEGTVSNYFFVKAGQWHTPCLKEGILPGIIRSALIASLRQNGVVVREGSYTLADVESAERVYLTNSLMGVMPVKQLNEKILEVDPQQIKALHDLLGLQRMGI